MYHFLFDLSGKIFRNFNKDKNIDLESEQIIDFCPKCNVTLKDKKVITLLNHERKFHPKTEKELVNDFYRKGSIQIYIILFILLVFAVIIIVTGLITAYLWESGLTEAELNAYEFCNDLIEKYPDLDILGDVEQSRIDRMEFALENIEDLKKCNYSIIVSSFGNTDKRIENYLSLDD